MHSLLHFPHPANSLQGSLLPGSLSQVSRMDTLHTGWKQSLIRLGASWEVSSVLSLVPDIQQVFGKVWGPTKTVCHSFRVCSDNFKLTPTNVSFVVNDPGGIDCVKIGWKQLVFNSSCIIKQKIIFFLKILFIFNWRIIAIQNFVVFCQTSTWISHRYTYESFSSKAK